MAGSNQHFIPRFLQRGFLSASVPGKQSTWVYARDTAPALTQIEHNGAEDCFYSPLSTDNSATLDDRITRNENSIANIVNKLRIADLAKPVPRKVATRLILHFAPRTKHFRASMHEGVACLMDTLETTIANEGFFARRMGLDRGQPSQRLVHSLEEAIRDHDGLSADELPHATKLRFFLQIFREKLPLLFVAGGPLDYFFALLQQEIPKIARDSHTKGIETLMGGGKHRTEMLEEFEWTLQAPALEGAILPDCVVWAYGAEQKPMPYMLADAKDVRMVVLPISSSRYLVGKSPDFLSPETNLFNQHAAQCSHHLFCASERNFAFESYASFIGSASQTVIQEAVANAGAIVRATDGKPDEDATFQWDHPASPETGSIIVRFAGQDDVQARGAIVEKLTGLIQALSANYPLSLLTTIIVNEPEDKCESSYLWVVDEAGVWFGISIGWKVATDLVSSDEQERNSASCDVFAQIVKVATMIEVYQSFPEIVTNRDGNRYDEWIHRESTNALAEYVAVYEFASAGLCTSSMIDEARNQLVILVDHMRVEAKAAMQRMAQSPDVMVCIRSMMPHAQKVQMAASRYVGLLAATQGELNPVYESTIDRVEMSINEWLPTLLQDLEYARRGLGKWTHISDVLQIGVHTERLLWLHGIIPHPNPEGWCFFRVSTTVPT